MKPRGKNFKKMNKKQKEKTKKTFERMNKIRKNDNIRIRQNIKDKLEYALQEQKKGAEAISIWQKNIQKNAKELLKIEGIILVLTQLLEESNKKEKRNDKKNSK